MLLVTVLFLYGSALVVAKLPRKVFYDIDQAEILFEQFIQTHDKQYADDTEKAMRLATFKQNLHVANKKNVIQQHATFGITQFMDLTLEEFQQKLTCFNNLTVGNDCTKASYKKTSTAPDSFDWRDKNGVTRVKVQGACGSCWAFSTIGNVESVYAIKHEQQIELSEQQLVDCNTENQGCNGGFMSVALRYLSTKGAMSEQDYPYSAQTGNCKYDEKQVKVKVSDCKDYSDTTEDKLKDVLVNIAPLSMALDGSDLQAYTGGILTCNSNTINHGVLLVGYGTDNDQPFWTFKNSWGESFGEKGYFRIQRGVNACGILNDQIVSAVVE
ncbi:uncharacterized protein LOC131851660 [Achroia grisella]|uniref:uncharacterized protein LOC131851660 n=1 Tax=Achroia grisella TaxID=688607 RepID=UPI0027D26F46|nr:uncharacterized protein LOC131851660 [Achroia grisella]